MLNAAIKNYSYLQNILMELEESANNDLVVNIIISHNDISVKLTLSESLIVINALATKKLQIRDGAWSSIGKKVEKPLVDTLCGMANVPMYCIDNTNFVKKYVS